MTGAAGVRRDDDRIFRGLLHERFLFTMTTGETFDGVLLDADDRVIILADTDSVAPNGDRLHVDGHLVLPRANVSYAQRPKG